MRIKATTISGSEYVLDSDSMTWEQVTVTERSGAHRSRKGNLISWPEFQLGISLYMFDDAVLPNHSAHCVVTSNLVKIELL
jgi:hypothetical protein